MLVGCPVDERGLSDIPVSVDFGPSAGQGGANDHIGIDVGGAPAGATEVDAWTFDQDTDGFTAENGMTQYFVSYDDAEMNPASGSLTVVNASLGNSDEFWLGGTWQCVSVDESQRYLLSFELDIPRMQRAGSAGFAVEFFNAPECAGLLLGSGSYLSADTGAWRPIRAPLDAPPGVRSMLLRLTVAKLYRDPSFEAHFDDVSLAVLE